MEGYKLKCEQCLFRGGGLHVHFHHLYCLCYNDHVILYFFRLIQGMDTKEDFKTFPVSLDLRNLDT